MTSPTRTVWIAQRWHPSERKQLFDVINTNFEVSAALYPGSYFDLSPAFVFEGVTFVDTDRRAAKFFADLEAVDGIIAENRTEIRPPNWRFLHADYTDVLPLKDSSFDLLVSLYAGVISDSCTRYLRPGGILLANPSHGDVAMAALNPEYRLVAVLKWESGQFTVHREELDSYLQPKQPGSVSAPTLRTSQRGIAYTKTPFAYLFQSSPAA